MLGVDRNGAETCFTGLQTARGRGENNFIHYDALPGDDFDALTRFPRAAFISVGARHANANSNGTSHHCGLILSVGTKYSPLTGSFSGGVPVALTGTK